MCGLTGLVQRDASVASIESTVGRMTDQLAHRGPDDQGVWCEVGIGLGHRRLAIVDLSSNGSQPFHSACGRYVLAFNGEVYNHLELRSCLERSHSIKSWRGDSDTETLLAAIIHWGIDEALKQASGMFALALWDRETKCLVLARDRMGEKPLYWGWAGKALVFGSELKALRVHTSCPTAVCPKALEQYLTFGYVPAPLSIHPGIYKLEPGCILVAPVASLPMIPPDSALKPGESYGGLSIRRFWSLESVITAGALEPLVEEDPAICLMESTLTSAVGRQMVSDVPLGAFLSGGVDSSLIVALMQAQSSRPVQTFTVGFEAKAYDESIAAAAIAKHLGTDHSTIFVSDSEAREVIPLLPDLYDEPFADSSQIPTYLVCGAARRDLTVALSGDAGDELFGGYNRYILGPRIWRRIGPMPMVLRHLLASVARGLPEHAWDKFGNVHNALRPPGAGIASLGQKVHRMAERLRDTQTIDALYDDITSIWPNSAQLMTNGRAVAGAARTRRSVGSSLPVCLDEDPAGRMMALDLLSYLPDDILCKVDRAAMGVGLETRLPFLDPAVIALSTKVPAEMKIRNGQGKWILRQVLYKHVPSALIDRPKTGFSIPLGTWLRGPLRGWAEDLLSAAALERHGLLNPLPIRAVWTEHLAGRVDRSAQLWIILMFQAWQNARV